MAGTIIWTGVWECIKTESCEPLLFSLSLLPECEGATSLHLSSTGKVTDCLLTVSHNQLFLPSVVSVRNVASTTRKVKNILRKHKPRKDRTHGWDLLWNICTIADFGCQDGNAAQKLLLWGWDKSSNRHSCLQTPSVLTYLCPLFSQSGKWENNFSVFMMEGFIILIDLIGHKLQSIELLTLSHT